ncbi:GNAT family N-acetyltransferase [Marinomonas balearica]|uniref:L-amino acid N-acyltransferase YncA n=1 Tax=Marinomonas balearica TaxID=491947 RepID=A0A4R6M909_9GAMM|nr:GNAT family N-acetyltransferase [Marinomonas balearica]TDO97903.1 L-amino acid N-acyltransferase YncA [Marinomonas balearica]
MVLIRIADFSKDTERTLSIFREYIESAPVSLDYQNNEQEFLTIAEKYSLPNGVVLLSEYHGEVVGCAAFRQVDASTCEMKRVYVRPSVRGQKTGEKLVKELIKIAKSCCYQRMCLDVLADFKTAKRLYESLGFRPCEPVSDNPMPGTSFLGLDLS